MQAEEIVAQIAQYLMQSQQCLCCAESCTGGWVAQQLTSVAGSSQWFDRGFVTYSNEAKQDMLGVEAKIIQQYGAVSRETVLAMASGALKHSQAHYSLAISGIAGPGGGSVEKPVGTVWIAWANKKQTTAEDFLFRGDRQAVRYQAVMASLQGLLSFLRD